MFISKLSHLKNIKKGVLSAAIILSVGATSLPEKVLAGSALDSSGMAYNDPLLEGLPEDLKNHLEKSVSEGIKALDSHIMDGITKDFFSEAFLKSAEGLLVKNLLGQVPLLGIFSDHLTNLLFGGDSGPSAEEVMIEALTQIIHQSEGRIIDAMYQIENQEAVSAAQSVFYLFRQHNGGDFSELDVWDLKVFARDLSNVRAALDHAGGADGGALRNIQLYMLVASLELSIWQKLDQAQFYKANPNGTAEDALKHFQRDRLRTHIEEVEGYLITGMAGKRESWRNEFGDADTNTVSDAVYEKYYEPALAILDDWRKIANMPRRAWADAEFYRAKTFGSFSRGNVVQADLNDDGVAILNLRPSTYEPISITTAKIVERRIYPDGSTSMGFLEVNRGSRNGGFYKERKFNGSQVVEYTISQICGYMIMSSREQCYSPTYENKIVLNVSLED